MAIISFNQTTFKVSVICDNDEAFTPDEKLNEIVAEAAILKNEYQGLVNKMNDLFQKCYAWNDCHKTQGQEESINQAHKS